MFDERKEVKLEDLERRYLSYINKADWETEYPYWISTDFGREFPRRMSCYAIADIIRKGKVVMKGTLEDHEHSCCYYNFKTKLAAERFAKRLARFIFNRKGE